MKTSLKPLDLVALAATLVVGSLIVPTVDIAQEPANVEAMPHVILKKLTPPVYPPLAHQAMIRGDVTVKVFVRPDGTVESVAPVDGPSILVQAAADSAKKSEFECVQCGSSGGAQAFTYSFKLSPERPDPCCCSGEQASSAKRSTEVLQSDAHITITAPPVCTCPDECTIKWAEEHSHFRSPKCLYLWKCGHRAIGIL